jgi:hypothetical protein
MSGVNAAALVCAGDAVTPKQPECGQAGHSVQQVGLAITHGGRAPGGGASPQTGQIGCYGPDNPFTPEKNTERPCDRPSSSLNIRQVELANTPIQQGNMNQQVAFAALFPS